MISSCLIQESGKGFRYSRRLRGETLLEARCSHAAKSPTGWMESAMNRPLQR